MPPHLPRLLAPVLLAMLLAFARTAAAGANEAMDPVLDASLKDKKGVVLYVAGQAIPGRVVRMDAETVELTSREFARIVVRRERIDAVAGY